MGKHKSSYLCPNQQLSRRIIDRMKFSPLNAASMQAGISVLYLLLANFYWNLRALVFLRTIFLIEIMVKNPVAGTQ